MIYGAITALREKDGSSKRAIEKYIERFYSGLPATHSSLLTHHLKRLKNSGHLVMVKKSYKLPGSEGSVPPPPPPPTSAADAASTAAIPSPGPARGRGRPPKNNPISDHPISQQPISQQFIPFPQQQQQPFPILQLPTLQQPIPILEQPISHHQQPIPIPQQPNSQPVPDEPNSQPMLVALGLADEPGSEKRRPVGRVVGGCGCWSWTSCGQPGVWQEGPGRPLGTRLPKKKAGRPPKPKSVSAVGGPNGIVKRGRGRPSKAEPKSVFFPYATNVPIIGAFEQSNVPNVRPTLKEEEEEAASAATVRVGGMVPGKRGRPPGLPGIKRPSKKSGRPVGRPRKHELCASFKKPFKKRLCPPGMGSRLA
ncbi:formin-like protein 5 [Pyrus ussuriensis x Pyrus communis]|uniref:Formin-like protein 5 n=1 Tax=Pyrus ussuriensis x Pyrus communis TaxID=2448454 RepID=A0A5N5I3J7_9ROSA|nr:formin-like protein 5 [Pyrus ussuriensis x Pyrus communis]